MTSGNNRPDDWLDRLRKDVRNAVPRGSAVPRSRQDPPGRSELQLISRLCMNAGERLNHLATLSEEVEQLLRSIQILFARWQERIDTVPGDR